MAIIDLVVCNAGPKTFAWKFGSDQLSTYTQMIVNETQEAYVVKGGIYDGPFLAGRHTLTTENLPLLRTLMGLPFGGKTPFIAEVWYVNKLATLDVRWGTPDPIQLVDPKYQIMVPVRAFGQYGLKITDSKKFLLKLVGTQASFDADNLSTYFRGIFISKIKAEIATAILRKAISFLEIAPHLTDLSVALQAALAPELDDYGVELSHFTIESINVPESDPAVIAVKASLAKRAEMGIVGFDYKQERSFDVMQAAASNEGTLGQMAGIGAGLGVGLGLGGSMGSLANNVAEQVRAAPVQAPPTAAPLSGDEKIHLLKEMAELKNAGILSAEEFEAEKHRILNS